MRTVKAAGIGAVTGVVSWAICFRLLVQQLTPVGLGAVSDEWADVAALVGFALGFVWQFRWGKRRSASPA